MEVRRDLFILIGVDKVPHSFHVPFLFPNMLYIFYKNKDLTQAANLVVKGFYPPSPIMKYFHQIKELDRLQSNFPYDDSNHSMYVAVSKIDNKTVIGFVDIDFRRTKRRYAPPRPYLSDLVVSEKWRRRGIAKNLILTCERRALQLREKTLYLRVEQSNSKALNMYYSLGYDFEPSKIFGVIDTTMLLKRGLQNRLLESSNEESSDEV